MKLLLHLLGDRVPDGAGVADLSLVFRGSVQVGLVAALGLLAGALVWRLYARSPQVVSARRRRLLALLRAGFLLLVLLALLRPVLALTVEGRVRRVLPVLVDDSQSMRIQDAHASLGSRTRTALAPGAQPATNGLRGQLSPKAPDPSQTLSRLDLAKTALISPELNLLHRLEQDHDLVPFSFGQHLTELPRGATAFRSSATPPTQAGAIVQRHPWLTGLEAQSPRTALGDALRALLARQRGQPLAGVFLLTDGANNSGAAPSAVAGSFREEAVPLYIWGLGVTSGRDIQVANLFAPEVVFVNEEVPVTVRVRFRGMSGHAAPLKLLCNGEVVAQRSLALTADGEQTTTLHFTPAMPGDLELAAVIDPRADEAVRENNRRAQGLKVIDGRLKVLLVEQSPRWEYRYLQAMLLRDRRVELQCLLLEGAPPLAQGSGTPYLEAFPQRKDELFAQDVVVLGDVNPGRLTVRDQENLEEWVSKFGGGLVTVAGKNHMPRAYRRTVLERMLPVEPEATPAGPAGEPVSDQPIELELTANGRASLMLRLSDQEEESAAIWKHLPPVYWVARVARAKPAAEVLLVDPNPARQTRFGKMPVLAWQPYGLGRVMYVGTDNTWRWRRNVGEAYYTALWSQMLQGLALQRFLGGSRRTQLTADRQNYATGEPVAVHARLYTAAYEPLQGAVARGFYRPRAGAGGRPSEVALRAVPDQPGLYRGQFVAPAPGHYRFFVEQDLDTPLDFSVREPAWELAEPALNESLLREMAQKSGGAFLREEDLRRLPDLVVARSAQVKAPLEVELWCTPLYFLMLLGVVSAEWLLRKRSQLR